MMVRTTNQPVVSHEEWLAARRALLEKKEAFTRQCDEMSQLQRSLPWERVAKDLIVYHFMFHRP